MRCLVRPTSDRASLPDVELCFGDLQDPASLARAVGGVDFVVHLASLLKVPWKAEFERINVGGTEALFDAIAARPDPPVDGTSLFARGRRSGAASARRERAACADLDLRPSEAGHRARRGSTRSAGTGDDRPPADGVRRRRSLRPAVVPHHRARGSFGTDAPRASDLAHPRRGSRCGVDRRRRARRESATRGEGSGLYYAACSGDSDVRRARAHGGSRLRCSDARDSDPFAAQRGGCRSLGSARAYRRPAHDPQPRQVARSDRRLMDLRRLQGPRASSASHRTRSKSDWYRRRSGIGPKNGSDRDLGRIAAAHFASAIEEVARAGFRLSEAAIGGVVSREDRLKVRPASRCCRAA